MRGSEPGQGSPEVYAPPRNSYTELRPKQLSLHEQVATTIFGRTAAERSWIIPEAHGDLLLFLQIAVSFFAHRFAMSGRGCARFYRLLLPAYGAMGLCSCTPRCTKLRGSEHGTVELNQSALP